MRSRAGNLTARLAAAPIRTKHVRSIVTPA
jgi:hypothetical protein